MCLLVCLSPRPHLSSQAVQDQLQPGGAQLQRDGQQLLSEPEHQRLQLGHAGQQLPRSGALVLGVRDGAGERKTEERALKTKSTNKSIYQSTYCFTT